MWHTGNSTFVIIILEVICCAYSLVLGYLSEKKFGKILNILLAIIWVIAVIFNLLAL